MEKNSSNPELHLASPRECWLSADLLIAKILQHLVVDLSRVSVESEDDDDGHWAGCCLRVCHE